jgi:exopolyphosphatase/guanosine-5'-triphosphate,3'-diphosphate pyrophosphatase
MSPSTPAPQRRAAIDVGTNSVKLLVADVQGSCVVPILEESLQTRLGRGFYQNHLLQPEPIEATALAVREFVQRARNHGAGFIRVIGTSAARDARNASELIAAILNQSGLILEVISGEREAEWAYQGVATRPDLASGSLLLLDVGGGSSEFIVGENSTLRFRRSFDLGTVRQLESLKLADPPGLPALRQLQEQLSAHFQHDIVPEVAPALAACASRPRLIGTGGTATLLGRMEAQMTDFDRDTIESQTLTCERIATLAESLWTQPLSQRQRIPGLPPNRADVILTGVVIYQTIMRELGFPSFQPSTRGLRFSALLH